MFAMIVQQAVEVTPNQWRTHGVSSCMTPYARPRSFLLMAATLATLACSTGSSDRTISLVTVDTLPGGIVRTMSSAPLDSGQWQLAPLFTIQPAEGALGELISPGDVVLTETGAVLVAERSPTEVKLYDSAGAYVRTFGREGEGPGEFRSAWLAVHGDTLLVHDPQLARSSTFRLSDGALLATHATTGRYWASLGVDGSHRAVIRMLSEESDSAPGASGGASQPFLRLGFSGAPMDTVHIGVRQPIDEEEQWFVRAPQLQFSVMVPLHPRDQVQTDPTGAFVTAWTGDYLLRVTQSGSDTVALFGRPFTRGVVTASEKRELVEQRILEMTAGPMAPPRAALESAFDVAKIPDVRPTFESFSVDRAGRTWVRRSASDSGYVTFDLFGTDRRWLDVVRVPARDWPAGRWASVSWGRDRVALYVEDELGRPVVNVYAVRRSEAR